MGFIRNINAWKSKTAAQKRKIKTSATEHVQARVRMVYKEALRVSPQWSGNYAYNWAIEITGYTGTQYETRFKVNPWQSLIQEGKERKAGDPEVIRAAMDWTNEVISQIKWNSRVTLVNHAPVSELIESGQVNLRPENLIPGGAGVITYLKMKYRNIG